MRLGVVFFLLLMSTFVKAECEWGKKYKPEIKGVDVVCAQGYLAGFDKGRKSASWTLYEVSASYLLFPVRFRDGVKSPSFIDPAYTYDREFYYKNGMDYAHLAPEKQVKTNKQIPARFSRVNRVGMYPEFNRKDGLWWQAEEFETKSAITRPGLIGLSGAIFAEEFGGIKYFYKVLVYPNMQSSIAFLFPHKKNVKGRLSEYITSIACIEERVGTELFGSLARYKDIRGDRAFALEVWTQGDQLREGCEIK